MRIVNDEIWVCADCMIWLVNGDVSGVEDEARVEAIQAGERALGEHIVSNFQDGEGEREFSRMPCDCCGTSLHGARYRMAQLGEGTQWAYGNGMPGCLHDHQSGPYETAAEAAEAAADLLELTDEEQTELTENGIVYFRGERFHEVGAGMVEIFEVDHDWTCD